MTQTLTITRPDDWHLHLRDGDMMAAVVTHSAREFARAIVMPNLKPPVTTVELADAYRERILAALPALLHAGAQLVVQGSGDRALEAAFLDAANNHPRQIAVRIAYDEALAHRVISGADSLLMPSRFEPCGLTQLYALRYGCLPLVHHVGGLADTVVNASETHLEADQATGFSFSEASTQALGAAMQQAIKLYQRPDIWQKIMRRAMQQEFSWNVAARSYLDLYKRLTETMRLPASP